MRAVGAAALLLGALVLTGRLSNFDRADTTRPSSSATISTQAPYRLGGGAPQCPPNWPVLATADHASYPAGNPTRSPAGATIVACYHTVADASSAGYPPEPPPPGVLEVGGVYLTPTSKAFQRDCRKVADRLGTMVPCPRLLPAMPPGFPPPRLCKEEDQCRRGEPLLFTQNEFVVPFGYVGAPGGYGALGIVAATAPERDGQPMVECLHELQPITRPVLGAQAVLASCADEPSESLFGGMDLLRWPKEGTRVAVAILGHSELNLRLAATLADHLRLVEARRPG